jgi:hypothetical protein
MVKYSPLNHLPSSVLMQIGNGPAILTLSVTVTSYSLEVVQAVVGPERRRQPQARQQRESNHCSHRTLCHADASPVAKVQVHDGGFGRCAASARPKRRFIHESKFAYLTARHHVIIGFLQADRAVHERAGRCQPANRGGMFRALKLQSFFLAVVGHDEAFS